MRTISTNFYWVPPGRERGTDYDAPNYWEGVHIGKRSGAGIDPETGVYGCGWGLQGHLDLTDAPVTSWRHWTLLLRLPGSRIFDEYSREHDAEAFIAEVESSSRLHRRRQYDWLVEHRYRFTVPEHVPEGEGPNLDASEWRTWLDADGFTVTFREFS